MRRIVVAGGLGFFGRTAAERLRADGAAPLSATRRPGADLRLDVEDPASLRAALRPGDVVLDTAGPFQDRTTALAEAALEIGCDLVDIADSRAYVARLYALRARFDAAGVRLLTACSSVSGVNAALVTHSGLADPVRVTGFLVPAAQYAANPGSGASLLRSVGQPVQVLRGGALVERIGWRDTRSFVMPPPIGSMHGHLFETADPLILPTAWPGLRETAFYVDSWVPGLNVMLDLGARSALVHALMARCLPLGLALSRRLGSATGCLAFEIEAAGGQIARYALISSHHGHYTPIAPAVLAVRAIAEGRFAPTGIVPPNRYVDPDDLLAYLEAIGVRTVLM
jgi:saccharopine dehydrogenase-like NADP-dependent oxidoreductase